jgi:hypothetical protein
MLRPSLWVVAHPHGDGCVVEPEQRNSKGHDGPWLVALAVAGRTAKDNHSTKPWVTEIRRQGRRAPREPFRVPEIRAAVFPRQSES